MNTPRHISRCIDEWLDGCPFNQPDAVKAIREELGMTAAKKAAEKEREITPVDEVLRRHSSGNDNETRKTA
jgi:hypothetical protein